MKYKLVCIDIDGTLLNDDHTITEDNIEAIREAKKKGVHIAIVSGRLYNSIKYFEKILGIDVHIISTNATFLMYDGKIVYENPLSFNQLNNIYEVIKKHNIVTYFNTWDTVICNREISKDNAYKIINEYLDDDCKVKFITNPKLIDIFKEYNGKILKSISISKTNSEALQKAKEELKLYDDLSVVSSNFNNFEVMNKGTSKATGIEKLSEILNIKREEIICIGDNDNDLSMIKYAGLGVAMGNGSLNIKKEADYITDTNNNSGVAKVINKFIL